MTVDHPTVTRLKQLQFGLCWDSTILAPALAGLVIIRSTQHPTAAIDNRGRCFVNTAWFDKLSDGQARFVILHECLHLILRHYERANGRDPKRFNLSADLVINDAIPALGSRVSVTPPEDGVFRDRDFPTIPPNLSVEEVYELLKDQAYETHYKPDQACAGCSVEPAAPRGGPCEVQAGGDGLGDEIDGDAGMSPGQWQNIAESVRNAARQASTTGGAALAALLTIPPSRVRWQALLRELAAQSISRAGRDVVSYSRKSRRSPRNLFLPGTRTNDVRLAIIIDSSGSVSDDELGACVAETRAAVDAAGVSALLVVHDHVVRSATWITPGSGHKPVATVITGRGGTVFAPAYDAVAKERTAFAAVVHFTDGCPGDAWPTKPKNCGRGIAAITTNGTEGAVPDGWRVVPIETPRWGT